MDTQVETTNALPDSLGRDAGSLRQSVNKHLLYTVGKDSVAASKRDWLYALSAAVRDRLVERWMDTTRRQYKQNVKRIYYLSMEFLPGRMLSNALLALGLHEECEQALRELGLDFDELAALEPDPALGNGGLGRLAACFLDSMATLGLPGFGYGIRYEYGMFAQRIHDGRQVEHPDHWLVAGNPWEFVRPEVKYTIQFGGRVETGHKNERGAHWVGTDDVFAMAYDTLVPGYGTTAVNTLRLWSATATEAINLSLFNQGNYSAAIEEKNRSENVSRVLYPDDSSEHGRELRLRQEYFFVSASLQDLLRRYFKTHPSVEQLADKVAIHLNDTHPAIAVPELMRLLVDVRQIPWTLAWRLCTRVFSYTNHTLMPEALETWPVALLERVLPRHMKIIYDINELFLDQLRAQGEDSESLRRVSLIDEGTVRRVRMANLSVLASHKVNGVSALHTELLRTTIFADFDRLFPGRFVNRTNGITPRLWLALANPGLSRLIDRHIGRTWRKRLDELAQLRPLAADPAFVAAFRSAKAGNKRRLADYVARLTGIAIDPESLFDVQIKRIHEYKRQLLNVLHVITRYNRILADPAAAWVPRTVIIAGKSASAYFMAKLIIKLVNDVAAVVNNDPRVDGKLKVVFVPNYGVSVAKLIIPAADLSEQISTAGTEASGTGNMKLALNGALTIGTLDGANIEIRDAVGAQNMFVFGLDAAGVRREREAGYLPRAIYDGNPELRQALDQIGAGRFSPDEPGRFQPIVQALLDHGDHYLLLADYAAYVEAQERADALYADPQAWAATAVRNVAAMGPFSSDRTIAEYAEGIWRVQPVAL
ncbi:MAG: glycogen/starch/alpha-glucan phosphorylase [Betaproteobacteria bacterium]|nr:glycogen/starch/alpha-glucan phosphorylase [Betaproteobacteria bacterium]